MAVRYVTFEVQQDETELDIVLMEPEEVYIHGRCVDSWVDGMDGEDEVDGELDFTGKSR